ncbi:hypothetical protein CRX72_08610 [Pantoea sp. BRM17]|nr:hypothetical protein CRX72_08610 [Pantoea sp. BRM17]
MERQRGFTLIELMIVIGPYGRC